MRPLGRNGVGLTVLACAAGCAAAAATAGRVAGDTGDTGAACATEVSAWQDLDGDGFGDPTTQLQVSACDLGDGVVANSDDCDDGDALAWTGAPEVACDGSDNDCDGAQPKCNASFDTQSDARLVGSVKPGALGDAVAFLGDVDGDGVGDVGVGDPMAAGSSGEAYVFSGATLAGTDGVAAQLAKATLTAPGELSMGLGLAGAGDVDGDGDDDLFAINGGYAYLLTGPVGTVDVAKEAVASLQVNGQGAKAWVGDADGDSVSDLFVNNTSRSYLYRGPFVGRRSTADSDLTVDFDKCSLNTRGSSDGLDADGDGDTDLLVSAPTGFGCDGPASIAGIDGRATGMVWVLSAGDATTFTVGSTTATWVESAASVGDWNGDGYVDLAMGPTFSVLFGPLKGDISADTAQVRQEVALPTATQGVVALGDVDGDGLPDAGAVGGSWSDAVVGAGVSVLLGGTTGTLGADGPAAFWTSQEALTTAFSSAASGGDVDGDGISDLLYGAAGSTGADSTEGRAFYVAGSRLLVP